MDRLWAVGMLLLLLLLVVQVEIGCDCVRRPSQLVVSFVAVPYLYFSSEIKLCHVFAQASFCLFL